MLKEDTFFVSVVPELLRLTPKISLVIWISSGQRESSQNNFEGPQAHVLPRTAKSYYALEFKELLDD